VAVASVLLPLLASLSGEAAALDQQGLAPLEIEQRLSARFAQDSAGTPPQSSIQPTSAQPEPVPPPPPDDWEKLIGMDAPEVLIDGRRRPGYETPLPDALVQDNPGAVRPPPPEAFPTDTLPLPDRWRIMTSLCPGKETAEAIFGLFANLRHVCHGKADPYHQNVLKGDRALPDGKRPGFLKGDDWFFVLGLTSDTLVEPRTFPIPVGAATTDRPGSIDQFSKDNSLVLAQTFILGLDLFKGSTAFKPPEIEYKLALALNVNYVNVPDRQVLLVRASEASHRLDHFLGVQEAFIDYHIRNTSDRYDFDSVRVGVQPLQADFRGFLFNDNQLAIRFFGNRDNNRIQYNLAAIWRLEKDSNSGLNTVVERPRDDFVFLANIYRQDFLIPSLTSQLTFVYNRNRERGRTKLDDNGFPARPALFGNFRPREYDAYYAGYNADGHIGRVNLTASLYGAFGQDRDSIFTGRPARISSFFGAAEVSYDFDWARVRLSGLYASGDSNPYDDTEGGFDAIFENPIFAGADTSYWIRQTIPFIGGAAGPVSINGRNGILNSLRSSKEQGQSNFNNPGTQLIGVGADLDLTAEFRVSANVNHLWFANTAVLQALRQEGHTEYRVPAVGRLPRAG